MNSMRYCQSKTMKSCLDELDLIFSRLVLWNKREFVTADNVPDTLASFLANVTRYGIAIAREKPVFYKCSGLFPRSPDLNPRYSGAVISAFSGTKATNSHREFILTHDSSRHDFRDLKGIVTRSRSPPVQLMPGGALRR